MGRNYFQLDLSRKLQYSSKRDIQRDIIAAHSSNPNRKQHIHGFDNHFLQTLLFSSIAKIIIMTKESHNSSFNFILLINIWCFYLCRTVRCLANSSTGTASALFNFSTIHQRLWYCFVPDIVIHFVNYLQNAWFEWNDARKNIDQTLMRPYI